MKFAWIQAEKAHYPVRKLCRWLAVTPSGFYAWCQRPESARAKRDRTLTVLVQTSFDASKQRYGSHGFTRTCASRTSASAANA